MGTAVEMRRELCSARVTLDGEDAFISGAACRFATVATLSGKCCQWAWETVERIVAAGGEFRS